MCLERAKDPPLYIMKKESTPNLMGSKVLSMAASSVIKNPEFWVAPAPEQWCVGVDDLYHDDGDLLGWLAGCLLLLLLLAGILPASALLVGWLAACCCSSGKLHAAVLLAGWQRS